MWLKVRIKKSLGCNFVFGKKNAQKNLTKKHQRYFN